MSVRKRTWTTSKGIQKTAWLVDYVDGQGRRRAKTFIHKKQADAFHASAKVEVRDGVHVPDRASITIAAAGKLWLATGEAADLERTTLDQRRQHLNLHIAPLIGETLLTALNGPSVRAFEDALRGSGRSPTMVNKVRVSLGSILADAVSRGLCIRNAVRETRAQRRKATERRHKRKLRVGLDIPAPDEIRAFLTAMSGHWRPMLMTAVLCGLRVSELRAVRWSDFEAGVLHVRQRADNRGDIGRPKSAASERAVPVPPMLRAVLEEWRTQCPTGPLDLMFPNGAGRVENTTNIVRRGLIPAMIAAGLTIPPKKPGEELRAKYQGMHALRHFFASWCINRKIDGGLELPPKMVQERLGHSALAMTMDTYGHLFPRGDDDDELASGEAALLGMNATHTQQKAEKPRFVLVKGKHHNP